MALVVQGSAACASGAPGSVGAVLKPREGRLFVVEAPPDMAGGKAGLVPEDEIVAIDGREVREMSRDEIVKALRGKVGSHVILRIRRDGMTRDVNVERGPFAGT